MVILSLIVADHYALLYEWMGNRYAAKKHFFAYY